MGYWWVSEPRLNVWLRDKPFFYKTTRGEQISFDLNFKNNSGPSGIADQAESAIFGVGTNWHMPWRSYVKALDPARCLVVLGNGSARQYVLDVQDYSSRATLSQQDTNEYVLYLPSGAYYSYFDAFTIGQETYVFLSEICDHEGHTTSFYYTSTNSSVRLTQITDTDGKDITFAYTNAAYYPSLISGVTGPYGQTCSLAYTTNGQLVEITDMIGMESQMEYDSSNRVSKLITSYGTNTFTYFIGTNTADSNVWKAVRIFEVGVRNHLYLADFVAQNALPSATNEYQSLAQVLQAANLSETLETNDFDQRNTFYWGPRQYDNLPQSIRSSLTNSTFSPTNLTANDFRLGRTSHWLKNRGTTLPSQSLSIQRAPSPEADGSTEGLYTWYDYAEKKDGDRTIEGKMPLPQIVAQHEPATPWKIGWNARNSLGNVTARYETYSEDTTALLWRTNSYTYAANGIDLTSLSIASTWAGDSIRTIYNEYNAQGLLSSNYNALDEVTGYSYDQGNRLSSIVRPSLWSTDYAYDADGWLTNVVERGWEQSFRTNSYTYTNGQVWTHTDERGLRVTNLWDALGRLVRVSYPDGTFITNTYDKLDLVQVVDRMGFTNRYERNAFGDVVRWIDPNNNTNFYDYCTCGVLDSMTDPMGNTTLFAHDNLGRRITTTYPGGTVVTNRYDLMDRLLIVSDSAGSVTNTYVVQGVLCQSQDASGTRQSVTYDFMDRSVAVTDANGASYSQQFDDIGRLTLRQDYLGAQEQFVYSLPGWSPVNTVYYTDPLNQDTEQYFDELGRKAVEYRYDASDNLVSVNTFTYSAAGDLLTLTDGEDQTTTWGYDEFGRVTNKVDAANNVLFRYQYDTNGHLIMRWTPGTNASIGITTRYQYDGNGNLTTVDYTNSPDVTLQYDANNRLTNLVDAVGTTRYTYTVFGAVASEDGPWDGDTVSYSYNDGRLRSGLSLQQPNASPWVQTYAYDPARRLTDLASPPGAFAYSYDPTAKTLVGRLLLPNGAYITNAYDPMARLTNSWLKTSGHIVTNSHAYTYNLASQRIKQTRTRGDYMDYSYDALGQLVGAIGKESGGTTRAHEQFKYQYDGAGNLAKRTNNALIQTFNVNSLNELSNVTRSGTYTVAGGAQGSPTSVTVADNGNAAQAATVYGDNSFARSGVTLLDGTNTFTAVATDALSRYDTNTVTAYLPASVTYIYDLNGNLRTNGTRLLDYDDENQLILVTEPGAWKSEFTYDGKMRRRIRREYVWGSGVWNLGSEIRYIYDGNLVLQERDAFNLPQVTYTRGRDLSGSLEGAGGIGGLLARTENFSLNTENSSSAHAYYHADGNGNITCLIATNQNVAARYLYDPFGNLLAATGPMADANLYRFSSKEWHPASGLVYYLYRHYDSSLQRWINRDPIREDDLYLVEPDDIQEQSGALQLFQFVNNDPIRFTDSFGLRINCNHPPECIEGQKRTTVGLDPCYIGVRWFCFWTPDGIPVCLPLPMYGTRVCKFDYVCEAGEWTFIRTHACGRCSRPDLE